MAVLGPPKWRGLAGWTMGRGLRGPRPRTRSPRAVGQGEPGADDCRSLLDAYLRGRGPFRRDVAELFCQAHGLTVPKPPSNPPGAPWSQERVTSGVRLSASRRSKRRVQ
jgi:hypothetical protein